MTRLTEVKTERDHETRRADLLLSALTLVMTTKPECVERVREQDSPGRYVIEAYGLTRAHGGIVVTHFIYPGQRDSIRADYLDSWDAGTYFVPFRIAAEHFRLTRNRLLASVNTPVAQETITHTEA